MDQTSDTPENLLEARAELQPVQTPAGDQPPVSVKHTYSDGCEVYGVPPFPEHSPAERQAAVLREESAGLIANQQAGAIAAEAAAAKAAREAEAAKIVASLPTGIVTADQVQQVPTETTDAPAA